MVLKYLRLFLSLCLYQQSNTQLGSFVLFCFQFLEFLKLDLFHNYVKSFTNVNLQRYVLRSLPSISTVPSSPGYLPYLFKHFLLFCFSFQFILSMVYFNNINKYMYICFSPPSEIKYTYFCYFTEQYILMVTAWQSTETQWIFLMIFIRLLNKIHESLYCSSIWDE